MFDTLQDRLGSVFSKLTGRGALSASDVDAAMREVRIALLEADVALPVVKDFIAKAKERATGQELLKSIKPGQMVVKIVNDVLVETLGSQTESLSLQAVPPIAIMMVGLQGSGKTTTTGKLAKLLNEKQRKKVLMASLDTQRPGAQEQLRVLGVQNSVETLDIISGQGPVDIAKRAMTRARMEGFEVVLLDTAGRLSIDEALMEEVKAIETVAKPHETLLVADAMTGQDAVHTAQKFKERLSLTGIVLTRVDGDARGGAALSMRAVTGCPIKFLGTGEKSDDLELFHPDRIANRILGMGDVVSLVERVAEGVEQDEAEALAKKMQKGQFDLNDLEKQLKQVRKMGGLGSIMGLMPGMGKMKNQLQKAGVDEKMITRQLAILSSMTKVEREKPDLIKASRKVRIAKGSGTQVSEVNKLLKQYFETQKMMKRMKKLGKKGLMRGGFPGLPPGGGGLGGGGMPPGGFPF